VKIAPSIESTFNPTTDCVDGLHPNYLGAVLLGNSFATAMNQCLPSGTFTAGYLNADNILGANASLTGTGGSGTSFSTGSVTGTFPTGWQVQENGGMTVVCTETTLNGFAALNIVVSGTNSTNGSVVNFVASANVTGNIGDSFEAAADFSLASGYANLRGQSITIGNQGQTTNTSTQAVNLDGAGAMSGTLRTAEVATLTSTITSINTQLLLTFAAGTVSANITWARPYARKIPTGQ